MAVIGKSIEKAAGLLKEGKAVAIPTETVYGLACNAIDAVAVANVFRIKKRPYFDPLIVHFSNAEMINKYAETGSSLFEKLASAFWPGPLSLVLPSKESVPEIVRAGGSTVAVRVPAHPLTASLLTELDFPLAAPSANPFGYVSPTTAEHVNNQLGDEIEYVLDGGPCKLGIESTVIKLYFDEYEILRLGGLSQERVVEVCGKAPRAVRDSSSRPESPGMLVRHYAPSCKVIDVSTVDLKRLDPDLKIGALNFSSPLRGIEVVCQRVLSSKSDVNEAAVNLFAFLRELDELDLDILLVEFLPQEGLGAAINDRLRRTLSS